MLAILTLEKLFVLSKLIRVKANTEKCQILNNCTVFMRLHIIFNCHVNCV